MPVIPSPLNCSRDSTNERAFHLNALVTVSYSGSGADAIADYLCAYLSLQLDLESRVESERDAEDGKAVHPLYA